MTNDTMLTATTSTAHSQIPVALAFATIESPLSACV